MLKDVDPEIVEAVVSKKNLILFNCFPVTPNCHRITEFGNHMVFVSSYISCARALLFLVYMLDEFRELSPYFFLSELYLAPSSQPHPMFCNLKFSHCMRGISKIT